MTDYNFNKLNKHYPEKLYERYNIKGGSLELDFEMIYNELGHKIGAMRFGEPDYERISNRIINDIKDEYIKGVCFDNEI